MYVRKGGIKRQSIRPCGKRRDIVLRSLPRQGTTVDLPRPRTFRPLFPLWHNKVQGYTRREPHPSDLDQTLGRGVTVQVKRFISNQPIHPISQFWVRLLDLSHTALVFYRFTCQVSTIKRGLAKCTKCGTCNESAYLLSVFRPLVSYSPLQLRYYVLFTYDDRSVLLNYHSFYQIVL